MAPLENTVTLLILDVFISGSFAFKNREIVQKRKVIKFFMMLYFMICTLLMEHHQRLHNIKFLYLAQVLVATI